ncbi:MAG: nitroreductase family protein [Dehalobacterium sp.]
MNFDQLMAVIKGRRSIRRFTNKTINQETINQLIEAGCWAPSGGNAQAWVFIVHNDRENMKKYLRFAPGLSEVPGGMIFICSDKERAYQKSGILGRDIMASMDASMAGENIMLAVHAMGLGSCVLKGFDHDAVKLLMNLPEHINPEMLIILGEPKSQPKAPARRPLSDVIHYEKWEEK